jgi:hypothetical protein
MRKIGDGDGAIYINDGNDADGEAKRKEELEKKLDPRKHQYLSLIHGGNRIEVPLQDFVAKYGNPDQYGQEELKKYILRTFYKF